MENAGRMPETVAGQGVILGAQAHLQSFYGHFGFTPVTDIYDEDGIPHIGMAREAKQAQ